MVKLPKIDKFCYWLFPDNIRQNSSYKFLGFEVQEHKGQKVPVFLLYGDYKDKQGEFKQGECKVSAWNIKNYGEIAQQIANISEDKLFFKITSDKDSFEFLVEVAAA